MAINAFWFFADLLFQLGRDLLSCIVGEAGVFKQCCSSFVYFEVFTGAVRYLQIIQIQRIERTLAEQLC